MRKVLAALAVVGTMMAAGCTPPPTDPPPGLVYPNAGCYLSTQPAFNHALGYSGTPGLGSLTLYESATDCTGTSLRTGAVVVAEDLETARATCASLFTPYDDSSLIFLQTSGWDLGPNAYAC